MPPDTLNTSSASFPELTRLHFNGFQHIVESQETSLQTNKSNKHLNVITPSQSVTFRDEDSCKREVQHSLENKDREYLYK